MDLPPLFQVRPENVAKNDALRQLAKSQLNNFYGKFSQNTNRSLSKYVNSQWLLDSILSKYEVENVTNVSDEMLHVEYLNPGTNFIKKFRLVFLGRRVKAIRL